jgi:O-antigen ligase
MYLQYAAERGIAGLVLMLWLIGKILRDFRMALRSGSLNRNAAYWLYGAIATILAILAEGFFEYNLGDSEVLTMFLTVLSCGYLVIEMNSNPGLRTVDSRLSMRTRLVDRVGGVSEGP